MLLTWPATSSAPVLPDGTALASRVTRGGDDALALVGGAPPTYAYTGEQKCLVGDDQHELLEALRAAGVRTPFTSGAISSLLHHGFVEAPYTVRRDVLRLNQGDRLAVTRRDGRFVHVHGFQPPFRNAVSRQDREPSTRALLDLMVAAVDRGLGAGPGVLMMSSGKDSVGLALACREAGRDDVRAITFASDPREDEAVDAAAFARSLGLPHETVVLPDETARIRPIVETCFERASEPCCDPTLVPYLLGVAHARPDPGDALLDGLNNDSSMGYVPSPSERVRSRIGERWLGWMRPLRRLLPCGHPLDLALRGRAEWHFFGGAWLRHGDTRRFFSGSVDTHARWWRRDRELRRLDDFDFRAEVRGRHADQNAMVVKARVAAECVHARPVFPYTDPELVDYVFHLPTPSRFDRERLVNKVLLRRLLRERLDYDDQRIGKRFFHFDGPRFLLGHRDWIEEEIRACPWWSAEVNAVVGAMLDRPASLRRTWPGLLALFQLSGWLTRHEAEGRDGRGEVAA